MVVPATVMTVMTSVLSRLLAAGILRLALLQLRLKSGELRCSVRGGLPGRAGIGLVLKRVEGQ